jgi:hypothetical protein
LIKLDFEVVQIDKDEFAVKCKGRAEGKRKNLIMEIESALETFEDQMPNEFCEALDIFLSKRGC